MAGLLVGFVAAFPGHEEAHAATVCDKYATTSGSTQQLVDALSPG